MDNCTCKLAFKSFSGFYGDNKFQLTTQSKEMGTYFYLWIRSNNNLYVATKQSIGGECLKTLPLRFEPHDCYECNKPLLTQEVLTKIYLIHKFSKNSTEYLKKYLMSTLKNNTWVL